MKKIKYIIVLLILTIPLIVNADDIKTFYIAGYNKDSNYLEINNFFTQAVKYKDTDNNLLCIYYGNFDKKTNTLRIIATSSEFAVENPNNFVNSNNNYIITSFQFNNHNSYELYYNGYLIEYDINKIISNLTFTTENNCPNQVFVKEIKKIGIPVATDIKATPCISSKDGCFSLTTMNDETEIKPSDKYNFAQCDNENKYIKECGCLPASLADIIKSVYFLLKLVGPLLFVIVGIMELIKAITYKDGSAVKKSWEKLIKKLIAAFLVFFSLVLIQWLIQVLAKDSNDILGCLDKLLNGYNY